ncbi:MAG: recombination regulator RecX [Candidatus Cloacimonetes bacterium]|jgi:regulatory protein|nr:recombination regulator RecX [Candidatus Cloacimonadota bacterium]MCB5287719.1 recombination regulator RecX [Candidatus Cloacimonadota bacterium]MCK9183980.1 recombination regulator RecX [Candidatus Cloacimonadota bacterium]MCK9583862.1 recombination regulator RecX [Candidatus Cloacimonadota bacterium]MDY0230040.1 regulatory protein RecX [Candidatus Cloacimonadaceae bacterium]
MKLKYWKKSERSAYLSLDDEIWGVLSLRTLQRLHPFSSELDISETQSQHLISELEKKAWWQITEYLAKAEHSEHQCRLFLGRKDYHKSIIDRCIELCKEKGYLDDARFAEILIRSLFERGKSARAITEKLYEQRIPPALYEPILQELQDPEQNRQLLREQIQKLLYKHRAQEPWKAKEKVYASLFRKGFSLDEIAQAWEGPDE